MTNLDEAELTDPTAPVDGRVARRQRNIDAVLDVVLELFAEDSMFPTIEQAATRSGLSLRSLYRYFADPGELLEATIKRSRERVVELGRIHSIGQGSLEDRLDDFVSMRLRLYEEVGPVYRATTANAVRHRRVADELASRRDEMSAQFGLQFAQELDPLTTSVRDAAMCAGDLLTQLDSIDFLRRHRGLSINDTHAVVVSALKALLT